MDKKKVWGVGIGLLVTAAFVVVVKFILAKKNEGDTKTEG